MDPEKTGLVVSSESELEGHYEAEFWHEDEEYDVGILEYDEEVMLFFEDSEDTMSVETVTEYALVEERGSKTRSNYRRGDYSRSIRTSTENAAITEENMEREIEAYIIKSLRPDEIRSDIKASNVLYK